MRKIKNQKSKIKNLKLKVFVSSLVTGYWLLVTSSIAFAVDGGGQAASFKDWFWVIVNFAVLVAILVWAGRKPMSEFFKKRTETIEKALKEAEEAKNLAQKTLDETKERLKNTESEINEILEAAKKSGEKDKEALIAEGERLKNKILEQTKTNIEFELQKAKKAIKSEAALMALELAEKQIKSQLGEKEHASLINEYIKKLEVNN